MKSEILGRRIEESRYRFVKGIGGLIEEYTARREREQALNGNAKKRKGRSNVKKSELAPADCSAAQSQDAETFINRHLFLLTKQKSRCK